MTMLNDQVRQQAQQFLEELSAPVRMVMFTQEFECEYCAETRQLVEEIGELSDHITVEVYDFIEDKDKAEELNIDKIPAIAVVGTEDYGVRFFGIPSGYEFTALLESIRAVGAGEGGLSEETQKALAEIEEPVHIQVFVTPTCPYCSGAVVLAHQMAVASPKVRADMVEAMEFPEMAIRYEVMGVPRTVINETVHIEGAAPEPMVLAKLQEALSGDDE